MSLPWNANTTTVDRLRGKTLAAVTTQTRYEDEPDSAVDRITFETTTGEKLVMAHMQDCCESVLVESIEGNLDDLVGSPLTMAEETVSDNHHGGKRPDGYSEPEWGEESVTWTFYRFATVKGYVTIRWVGESNGYYSESVDCAWEEPLIEQEGLTNA